jgi:hypothetical protein
VVKKYIISSYFTTKNMPKNCGSKALKLRTSEKFRLRNCGVAVAEHIFLKVAELRLRKCFLQVAELRLRTQKKKVARAHLCCIHNTSLLTMKFKTVFSNADLRMGEVNLVVVLTQLLNDPRASDQPWSQPRDQPPDHRSVPLQNTPVFQL